MNLDIDRLKRNIKHDQKFQKVKVKLNYVSNHRYIPQKIYCELKQVRTCEHCHKDFNHPLEIHHKVPISKGGTNQRENLIVICNPCHRFLDGVSNEL